MVGDWTSSELGKLTINFDGKRKPVKESNRRPGPYPYYGASGIVDYVDGYLFDGDYLLIAEDGENLRTRQTPIAFIARGKFWVNNHAHIVVGNENADTRFLMYALHNADTDEYLTGAVMPKLTQGNLNRIVISHPCLAEQRRIAHILGTLDDRIENNRKTAKTLEAMAQAIFQSWFVDFDPVRAKMAGESKESICKRLKLTPEILDLFPDRLVDSELGEIPEGWRVGKLGEFAKNVRRTVSPTLIERNTAYIALEHMPRQSISLHEWDTAASVESNKYYFRKGEILFGKLRPYFHKVGIAPTDGVCSTDILVIKPKSSDWLGFSLGHLSSKELIAYATSSSTGTRMPRTSCSELAEYAVVIPTEQLTRNLNEIIQMQIGRIISITHVNRSIKTLRDTLLPKLISGDIRVSEEQETVEEALL